MTSHGQVIVRGYLQGDAMRIVLLRLLLVVACAGQLSLLRTVTAIRAADKPSPRTIQVPADHARIQQAIDVAADGDTVLVAPGTYRESLQLKGKQITLASRFLVTSD